MHGVLKKPSSILGIEKRVTGAYSPATNGAVERFNRTLMRSLKTLAADSPDDWDLSVDFVAMAYRNRVHSATNFNPFELTFGRPANFYTSHHHILTADSSTTESLLGRAYEIWELVEGTLPRVVADLVSYQAQQMATQNNAIPVRHLPLPIGSLAYVFNNLRQKKMQARYKGPYKVAGVTQHGLYILANRFGQHLKKAFPLDQLKVIDPLYAAEVWEAELTQVFTVDAIIDHRIGAGHRGTEYLVQWRGFDSDHNSWVRATDILDLDLIATFEGLATSGQEGHLPSSR